MRSGVSAEAAACEIPWSKPVNALQIANMVVCYTLVPLQKFPEWLFFSSFSFLLFGLCYGMVWSSKTVNGESGAG